MAKETRRLGRGIASLLSTPLPDKQDNLRLNAPISASTEQTPEHRLAMLPIDSIRANPSQPRHSFDDAGLASLADSIRQRGALQPIVVRPAEGGFELVAGERRLRAAALAGKETIPAIVRAVKDDDLLELALIENIHRQDLNPIERAKAYRALQERSGLTHEAIGQKMGEDRATVANYIRLLDLHPEVRELLASGKLGMGHARAILGITDKQAQLSISSRVVAEGWSVRAVEKAVAKGRQQLPNETPKVAKTRPAVAEMERRLTEYLGARVTIKEGRRRHAGKVMIEYRTLEEFDRIVSVLGIESDQA